MDDQDSSQSRITVYALLCWTLAASGGGLLFGYDIGITVNAEQLEILQSGKVTAWDDLLHTLSPSISRRKHLAYENNYCKYDNQYVQLFISSLYLAALASSFAGSKLCMRCGRRFTIRVASIFSLVGAIMSASAQHLWMLIFGRIVQGIGVGFANEAVPLFLFEVTPVLHHGAVNSLFQLFITSGICFASLVNYYASKILWGWRLSLGLAGVPAAILFVSCLIIPETPPSLIEHGNYEEGRKILKKIRGVDVVGDEFNQIEMACKMAQQVKHPFKELMKRSSMPPLIISIFMQMFQHLTGISAIMFHAPVLFYALGFRNDAVLFSSVIPEVVIVVSTIVSLWAVDKISRRKMLLSACALMFICQDSSQSRITVYALLCWTLAASGGGLLFGYDIGITVNAEQLEILQSGKVTAWDDLLHTLSPSISRRKHLAYENNYCKYDNQYVQLFISSLYLAALASSFAGSKLCMRCGRRFTIRVASIFSLVGAIMSASAQHLWMLIFGRIVQGIGVGFANEAVPLFLFEVTPVLHHGAVNSLFQLFITSGICFASLVNYYASKILWGWRLSLGLAGVPAAILFVSCLIIPETPPSLIEHGNYEEGRKILKKIRGVDVVGDEFNQIEMACKMAQQVKHPFKELMKRSSMPPLIISIFMQMFQHLTGISAIMFHAPVLFYALGFRNDAVLFSSVIPEVVIVVSTIVSLWAVDKISRRKMLLSACALMFICQDSSQSRITVYALLCWTLAASGGGLLFGYDIGITVNAEQLEILQSGKVTAWDDLLHTLSPSISRRKHLAYENNYCKYDNQYVQLFISSLYLAALASSFAGSKLCMRCGRRFTIRVASIFSLVGAIMSASAQHLWMLIFGRIVQGIGVGFANEAVPLFLFEVTPVLHHGAVNSLFQLFITSGICFASLVNYYASKILWGWRLSLGLAGVPAAILFVSCLIIPETPPSLIEHGNYEEGRKILKKIRGVDVVGDEFNQIEMACKMAQQVKHPFKELMKRSSMPPLIISIFMQMFQHLTGISAIMFHAPVLFYALGFRNDAVLFSSVIPEVVIVVSTIVSLWAVDKISRRKMLLSACALMFICQIAIGVILEDHMKTHNLIDKKPATAALVFACLFLMAFAWSWGPLSWLIPLETFPQETRAAGFAFVVSSNMFFTILTFQALLSMMCHMHAPIFLFFAAWIIVMGLFVFFLLPETKNVPVDAMVGRVWKQHPIWKKFYENGGDAVNKNSSLEPDNPHMI